MTVIRDRTEASLFATCVVDQVYPEVGESVVRVLRRCGVDLDFPTGQTCCGQPAFNSGFWGDARPLAKRFLDTFKDKQYIVLPSGSCTSMVRVFYKELLHDDPSLVSLVTALAPKIYEFSEFIVDVLGISDMSTICDGIAQPIPRKVTYHEACHLRREIGVKTQPRELIRSLPGVELIEMDQAEACCGFGGTFAVKYSDISGAILQEKVDHVSNSGADTLVSCDITCLMQISGSLEQRGINIEAIHLAQLIDKVTSLDRKIL